jgi:hypothetical protein
MKCDQVKGVMRGLTGRLHSMAQEEGGVAAWEEEVVLDWHRQRRKREAGGAMWAKKAKWAGWLLGRLGRNQKKYPFKIKIGFLNLARLWKFAQGI